MKPGWFPDWSEDTCVVIASGPSAKSEDDLASLVRRCRVIVVNNSHELVPVADCLYAADEKWWDAYPAARSFAGLKVTQSAVAAKRYGLHTVNLPNDAGRETESRILIDPPGTVGRGGNSGFQAINLAIQFGAKRLVLVGFDFVGEHWHGKHEHGLKNPRQVALDRWAQTLDAQKPIFDELGITVVNCSRSGKLKEFEVMSLSDATAEYQPINLDAAEMYLAQARSAREAGDDTRCAAACRMVILALDNPPKALRIHTEHLKKK